MIKKALVCSPYFNASVSGERLSTREKVFLEWLGVIRPIFVPGRTDCMCWKQGTKQPKNASCAPCTWGCSIFSQSRPYWNPQYNEQQAYRHCTLRLTLTVTVNPKNTIICGFSCPLTLQLLLQILPQVARFILLDLKWMLSVERNVVVDHSAVKDT